MPNISENLNKWSKIEKVPRGIRGEKSSKDMASSRNLVSTIGALASPKMGDGTRCQEVLKADIQELFLFLYNAWEGFEAAFWQYKRCCIRPFLHTFNTSYELYYQWIKFVFLEKCVESTFWLTFILQKVRFTYITWRAENMRTCKWTHMYVKHVLLNSCGNHALNVRLTCVFLNVYMYVYSF